MRYTSEVIAADFKTAPYRHQLAELEGHLEERGRAFLWHMRTGKSKAFVDRSCHLFKRGLIDAVAIFAPNGVHDNWMRREVPTHCWDSVDRVTLTWQSRLCGTRGVAAVRAADRERWREEHEAYWAKLASIMKGRAALPFLAFNSESMTRDDVRRALARLYRNRRVHIGFDESDDFGVPGTKRTKMARSMAYRSDFRTIMSGSAVTGSPLAAFSQFELVEREALGHKLYDDFVQRYAEYKLERGRGGRHYPTLIGYRNLEELRERMARFSSVVLREDCDDMPDIIPEVRRVEPTRQQREVYSRLLESFIVELEGGVTLSVGEQANRLGKLQQVLSGFVIDENKRVHDIPGGNPRLDALSEEVYLSPGKVVVWCQFREDIDRVCRRLRGDGHEIVEYHGRVSDGAKLDALARFRDEGAVKGLVGHVQSGGRGQDMSTAGVDAACDTIIWYSHTFKARLRAQASERATKLSGRNIRVLDMVAPGADEYILDTVAERVNVADMLAGRGLRDILMGVRL